MLENNHIISDWLMDYFALLIYSCVVKQMCRIMTPKYGLHVIFHID